MRRLATIFLLPFALAACGGMRDPEWSRQGGKTDPTALALAEVECRETARMTAGGGFGRPDASSEAMAACMRGKGYVQASLKTTEEAE